MRSRTGLFSTIVGRHVFRSFPSRTHEKHVSGLARRCLLLPPQLRYTHLALTFQLSLLSNPVQFPKNGAAHQHSTMCMLNFSPFDIDDEDGPDYPFPRARPRLAWALPVNMNKLGASLQALTDSAPQTTTLRLCHKFRDGPLSKLPQELLEHIVDNIQGAARAKCLPGWYQDSICWQGTCRHEDHYKVYGEEVEKLWQKIFVDKAYGKTFEKTNLDNKTEAEKVDMVQDWVQSDPSIFDNEEGHCLHFDAMFRWLDRCCTCPQTQPGDTRKVGSFGPMNPQSPIWTRSSRIS
ncbi:hypothetical protein HBI56_076380 [Parastagonospora nodorum]|uniref:Uncharacterized protein n=1 Tax=Phaeosphaeria nodorum (strain SN15 / ATCC MYA-4574 / FGSC 10173) TaxID=321614 RepID=A0A7U2EWL7_PHANO|nr:hypothetical protein HBH56_150780 [Parastagonospora nodorum]QRC94292.1 hypothetical protein JI435_305400 [Parastagonospora nodorum SN15]KAH3928591.1 hypothetical protein HBH54_136680 [Parastagonospora nodorum]KAH3985362.1 hypothetical protein HBH51_020540 [Parastagonospora nodorum]KAH4037854.1 hypothetical protein HBI09_059840 [Parastagonospora nodorum]